MVTLPDSLRDAFKEPMGPVTTDADELLAAAAETREEYGAPDAPIVAVGDVVTYHLREAGRVPDVALVDGKTEREAVRTKISDALAAGDEKRVHVENPAATLTVALLERLVDALTDSDPVTIEVDGEEDLAALPAIIAAPDGSSVVYGQPGEGMVRVAVTPEARERARELFEGLDGDVDGAFDALGQSG
ncbi:GTP-dependent dephospho-CoA kinase family protein [Halorubrum cibi]|uniref:GTP-dependent dephospho-CoA kinase family protein n=1 Tax=Halorubrum cibi TaxID=413815 RepID=UPI00115E5120|nr:GTP-dependent dephospho-CoA kinase family protein [Halorubrum cibi]